MSFFDKNNDLWIEVENLPDGCNHINLTKYIQDQITTRVVTAYRQIKEAEGPLPEPHYKYDKDLKTFETFVPYVSRETK